MLLPETGENGLTHIAVRFVDGKDPIFLDGESAFWSP